MCLAQCGPNRISNEWTQCINSYTNEHGQGGGGWSLTKFSLESLYEQKQLLRNKWTASNVLMPLCRYQGCKFKFYKNYDTDYIVHYSLCSPMYDTVYQHTNAHPSNMLLYYKKIIVPCIKRNPKRKKYITKKLRPPEQFRNSWYFQKDLNKQPLVLLTTTLCDLDRFYLNPLSKTSNISITVLNYDIFNTPDFQQQNLGTKYWQPNSKIYLYGTHNGDTNPTIGSLVFLGQTKNYTEGKPINNQHWETYSQTNLQSINFGNIFYHYYLTGSQGTFKSTKPPNEVFNNMTHRNKKINDPLVESLGITPNTTPYITTVRYNPDRDTGKDNKIWLVKDTYTSWDPPEDEALTYEGFPLWCILWGWTDWQIKLAKLTQILEHAILVIQTKQTYPTYQRLIPIDTSFIDAHSPYVDYMTPSDSINWHPKVKHQQISIDNICKSGPGTVKTSTLSVECHCNYCFYFKWGGCPNDLQNIQDPAEQTKYPIPNNQLQEIEIDDPKTDPKTCVWPFDLRRGIITKKCSSRIRKDSETDSITFTDSKLQATPCLTESHQILQTQDTSSTEEEEKTTTNEQLLLRLRKQRRKLQQQLQQLMYQTPTIKY